MTTKYDYIIIGAGAAGLMLAETFGTDPFFKTKQVLILDKDRKDKNDRTWCYWEKGTGKFDDILFNEWNRIHYAGDTFQLDSPIAPYSYKMIRGLDFYSYMFNKIEALPNVSFRQHSVLSTTQNKEDVTVKTDTVTYTGNKVFNSVFDIDLVKQQTKYPLVQQHFVGWFIKSEEPIFNSHSPTFMDFSIAQNGNTRFMYVLPFSEKEGLVEYTLFSPDVLKVAEYEKEIELYISKNLHCTSYEILEKEKGNIPMTCFSFSSCDKEQIMNIGLAGGWAKASTGYTFMNTQKKVKELSSFMKKDLPLNTFSRKNKFWFYDLLLLDILYKQNSVGSRIFNSLFKKCKPQLLLKFLDEETSLLEDVKVISSCPKTYFIKALLRRIF